MSELTKEQLAQYIDHTNLSPIATFSDIKKLCDEAIEHQFKSVCINPYYVKYAKEILKDTNVLVCTVIGFPLGMNTIEIKVNEAIDAIKNGADEIDMVINEAELKKLNKEYCLNEINSIKKVIGDKTLKVIVETSQLNDEQKDFAARLILTSDAEFIKTSTGYIGSGAQIEDVKNWKKILNGKKLIKAAGGIRTYEDLIKFIKSGSDRIGSSKGVEIIK